MHGSIHLGTSHLEGTKHTVMWRAHYGQAPILVELDRGGGDLVSFVIDMLLAVTAGGVSFYRRSLRMVSQNLVETVPVRRPSALTLSLALHAGSAFVESQV